MCVEAYEKVERLSHAFFLLQMKRMQSFNISLVSALLIVKCGSNAINLLFHPTGQNHSQYQWPSVSSSHLWYTLFKTQL